MMSAQGKKNAGGITDTSAARKLGLSCAECRRSDLLSSSAPREAKKVAIQVKAEVWSVGYESIQLECCIFQLYHRVFPCQSCQRSVALFQLLEHPLNYFKAWMCQHMSGRFVRPFAADSSIFNCLSFFSPSSPGTLAATKGNKWGSLVSLCVLNRASPPHQSPYGARTTAIWNKQNVDITNSWIGISFGSGSCERRWNPSFAAIKPEPESWRWSWQ